MRRGAPQNRCERCEEKNPTMPRIESQSSSPKSILCTRFVHSGDTDSNLICRSHQSFENSVFKQKPTGIIQILAGIQLTMHPIHSTPCSLCNWYIVVKKPKTQPLHCRCDPDLRSNKWSSSRTGSLTFRLTSPLGLLTYHNRICTQRTIRLSDSTPVSYATVHVLESWLKDKAATTECFRVFLSPCRCLLCYYLNIYHDRFLPDTFHRSQLSYHSTRRDEQYIHWQPQFRQSHHIDMNIIILARHTPGKT